VKFEYLYLDTGNFNTTYSLLGIGLITERSRMTRNRGREMLRISRTSAIPKKHQLAAVGHFRTRQIS